MEIRVKLTGFLKDKTPPGGKLNLTDGSSVSDAIDALSIPGTSIQSCLVNGRFERDRSRKLSEGDELSILPPVGGGYVVFIWRAVGVSPPRAASIVLIVIYQFSSGA